VETPIRLNAPIAILLSPEELFANKALLPIPILSHPEFMENPADSPIAILWYPDVLACKVPRPSATL